MPQRAPQLNLSSLSSISAQPALAHLHGLVPLRKALSRLVVGDGRLEDGPALRIHMRQLVKVVPDPYSKSGSDGSAKGCCFAHCRAQDRDSDEIRLRLEGR